MTALTPGSTNHQTDRRRGDRRRRQNRLASFASLHVRMWVVILVALIGAVLIWAVASSVNDVDRRLDQRAREETAAALAESEHEAAAALAAAEHEAAMALYESDLRAYDNAVRDRNVCINAVVRDEFNRGQHLANVQAYEQLLPLTPPAYQVGIQLIIDTLKAGPLLSSEPFAVEECPTVPPAPVAPG